MFPRQLRKPGSTFFLLGPRGTGKTTWILQHFPETPRYDLLRSAERLRLSSDPAAFGHECDALPVQRELGRRPVTLLGVFTGPRPLGREGVRVLPWRRFLKALWNDELIMPG